MSTWAKVCQTMGAGFEPYLQTIMPLVFRSAAIRADVSVMGEFVVASQEDLGLPHYVDPDHAASEREGYEVLDMQGQRVEIRTASLEEKCTAFDVLLVICSVMGQSFTPYLSTALQLALPALKFFFHDGVRETAALFVHVPLFSLRYSYDSLA